MTEWKYVSCIRRGVSHIANNSVCQDNVRVYEDDDCIIAALADGLGSLSHSETAAETATESVCTFLQITGDVRAAASEPEYFKKRLIAYVTKEVIAKAEKMTLSVKDMDCTLAFVYVSKKDDYAICGRLGDSAICIIDSEDGRVIADSNMSANGTNTLFVGNAAGELHICELGLNNNHVLGFILTSDGLDNELYMKGSPHLYKITELYFNAVSTQDNAGEVISKRLDALIDGASTQFDDDISLAVLSRTDKPITLPDDPTWLCICGNRNIIQNTYCSRCHNDFVSLYRKVRFRDYGGRAAFFTEINRDPDRERGLLGLAPGDPFFDPSETTEREEQAAAAYSRPAPADVGYAAACEKELPCSHYSIRADECSPSPAARCNTNKPGLFRALIRRIKMLSRSMIFSLCALLIAVLSICIFGSIFAEDPPEDQTTTEIVQMQSCDDEAAVQPTCSPDD